MGKAKRLKLLRRAARQLATGQPDTKYDLSQSTNPEKQSPVILKQGCRKALYKQLKKDNPTIAFEDENGTHGKTTR